ncbi:MAG TPA: PQQ-dependent sugar dehydrogenase, partial [Solirubrobacteraceae bacterium]|nr:PQQ-dependent sugar dehydrogenase [Solirubrobacteraceae bacterium]
RRAVTPALLLLALLVPVGCGGDDEPSGRASDAASPTRSATTPDTSGRSAPGDRAPVRADGADPQVRVITTGLEVPWDVVFLPDGRALVTERPGRVRLVSAAGELREEPVARVRVEALGEGGLMGIALDPAFAAGRPFVYLMATRDGEVRVLRYRWSAERTALTEDGVALDGIEAGPIHDSGRIRFGPDDRLYVVTGDAGRRELAQQRASLNGKVLSLAPSQYRRGSGAPRIVSIGHRNPQGLDWQPGSDRLFVTEHGPSGDGGPSCCDEVNVVRQGGNALWPRFGRDQPGDGAPEQLWQDTIAPSGSAFVSLPDSAWTGDHLVAALLGTSLRRLEVDGARIGDEEVLLDGEYGRLRAVVEAPDGAIWVTTSNRDGRGSPEDEDDRIIRVVPPGA